MSNDLHELMSALADEAPPLHNRIALADAAYADGRRRRTVRIVEKCGAATVLVVCLLMATVFVGSSPLAARYGASSATSVSGYPRHIGQQFPILDLPAKPGPIAGLLAYGEGWWAVSATGHRWNLPQSQSSYQPAVSADGRMIGYLKSPEGPYVVRDLVAGTTVTVPSVGSPFDKPGSRFSIGPPTVGYFSADDRYLALTGSDSKGQATVAFDTRGGTVASSIHSNDLVAGWAGDDVVTVSLSADRVATAHSLDGGTATRAVMKSTGTLPDGGAFTVVVSSDGTKLGYVGVNSMEQPDSLTTLTTFLLATGVQRAPPAPVPSMSGLSGYAFGRTVAYLHKEAGSGAFTVVDIDGGTARTATSIAVGKEPYGSVWASDAFDGVPRSAILLDRLSAQWIAWQVWIYRVVGLGAVLALLWWRIRRRNAEYRALTTSSAVAKRGWSRRRKVLTITIPVVAGSVAIGLLTYYLFVPLGTGNLVSSGSALWWSPVDQAAASRGGADGDPASVVPLRQGELQGFVVLVRNPTGRAQRIIEPVSPDGWIIVTVAKTAGTQPRRLTYSNEATIPAHGSRWVRVLLRDDVCWQKGSSPSKPSVEVHTQIGLVSRDQQIPLQEQMKLTTTTDIRPPGADC